MLKKYKNVMQDGIMDCGVCSLLTIIQTYGGNVSKEYLRELTHTNKEGTNALYLLEAGKSLGFDTKALKGDIFDLDDKYLPCIAHTIIDNKFQHFMVVEHIDRKKGIITVSDPANGIKKYNKDIFDLISTKHYLTFIPHRTIPVMQHNHTLYQSIIKYLLKYKHFLISIVLFSLIYTLFNIVGSFTFQLIIENAIAYASQTNLIFIIIMMSFIYVVKSLVDYFRNNLLAFINHGLDKTLIVDIYKHIISLPYLYYKTRTTGEIVARISDLGEIKDTLSNLFLTIFVDLILMIFVFLTLLHINSFLIWPCVIVVFIYVILIKIFNKPTYNYIKQMQTNMADVNSYLVESINNIDTVKTLGVEDNIIDKMQFKYQKYLNISYKFQKLFHLENFIKNMINDLGLLLIMMMAVLSVLNGKMTVGEVITYNALIVYFLEPIKNVIQLEMIIKKAKIAINRINELYDIKKEDLKVDEKYLGIKLKGHIKINNLNYSYYGRKNILNNINLDILAKNKVMIYGKSGSGKSTLGKILMKLLNVERNKVFIDDKDINDYNTWDLRKEICYIGQNENVFTDTIYNNIVMNREVDYDKFLDIAKITKVDEIINSRDTSYEMLLEENGFNISGGERQRLILARALLKNSSIYILDESLSQVDIAREKEILMNLFNYFKDKTIIYISHRFHNQDIFDQKINIMESYA